MSPESIKFTNFFKTKWFLGESEKFYSTSSIIRIKDQIKWILRTETEDPQI